MNEGTTLPLKKIFYAFLAIAISYCIYFFFKIIYESQINDYVLSENLIFYTSHFFRRALWGTFIVRGLHISDYQGFLFYLYAALFLLTLFYFLFINKDILLRILYVVSPLGLFFMIADRRAFARKETLFIPFIFLVIAILKSKSSHVVKFAWMLVLSIIMSSIHDTFLFLVFPLFLYFMIKENFHWKLLAAYVLLVFCFVLLIGSIHVPGTDVSALNNFFSLKKINWSYTRAGLTNNLSQTLDVAIEHLFKWNFILFILIALLHAAILNYFFKDKFSQLKTFLVLQSIFLIALFLIAMDYGRWIAFAFFNIAILLSVYSGAEQKRMNSAKLFVVAVFLLCLRVPIWSQFTLFDSTLLYQFVNPVILHALNLPTNDF